MGQICSKRKKSPLNEETTCLDLPPPSIDSHVLKEDPNFIKLIYDLRFKITLEPQSLAYWQQNQQRCVRLQYTELDLIENHNHHEIKVLTKNPLKHLKKVSLALKYREMNMKRLGEMLKKSSSLTRIKSRFYGDERRLILCQFNWANPSHIPHLWTGLKRLKSLEISITKEMLKDVVKLIKRCAQLENIVIMVFDDNKTHEELRLLGKSLERLEKLEHFMFLGLDHTHWKYCEDKKWWTPFLKSVRKVELLKTAKLGSEVRGWIQNRRNSVEVNFISVVGR